MTIGEKRASTRRIRANRKNSRASTGPRTAAGKAASAKNALRHGLGTPVLSNPALAAQVDLMAQRISGDLAPHMIELARRIAEAEVDVLRIRRKRVEILSSEGPDNRKDDLEFIDEAMRLIKHLMQEDVPEPAKPLPYLFILKVIDNYERRALSRRKFAIRDFDAARAGEPQNGIFKRAFEISRVE